MLSSFISYAKVLVRLDDPGTDRGLLCFRACSSVLLVHPKGGRPGGTSVVTSYTSVVLGLRDPSDLTVLHGVTGVDGRW